jgi:amino acid transporter
MIQNEIETNPESSNQLPRLLGPWMATAIVIGTVIGSGVFKKAKPISENLPEVGLAMTTWIIVGLVTMFGALSLAEVAVVYPRAGGNYVFLRESYGRLFGFLWGWVEFWFIRSASIAALAWIFAESFADVSNTFLEAMNLPTINLLGRYSITVGVILLLAALNIRGTLLGGRVQVVVTSVKVFSLVGIALLPFILFGLGKAGDNAPSVERLYPLFPQEWSWGLLSKFGAAAVAVFWAYDGWMNIAPIAGEVTNPSRNLPRAVIGGVFTLILLYVSVNLAYYLTIPANEIAKIKGRSTAGEFALRLLGHSGLMIASGCLMLSVFGSLNGNLLVGPRLLFAMAKDDLVPARLAAIHPKYGTPAIAMTVMTIFSCLIVIGASYLKYEDKLLFDAITDFSMFGALSFGALAVGSIFVVRKRYPVATVKLAYRCPLYPITPILYIVCTLAVVGNMFITQPQEAYVGAALIALGAVVYFVAYRAPKVEKEDI